MLGGLISGLIVGWILTLFNIDRIFIEVLQPFITQVELTTNHFYFVIAIFGLVNGLVYDIRRRI